MNQNRKGRNGRPAAIVVAVAIVLIVISLIIAFSE
ncbi:hypothetical protein OPIT5_28370 [Opitutaceae bacterium TAV5]|nr:hypothetical protein OPIT5_28370 [Opitutaceae bacterium TAV5]